jgi:ubiquitin-protein ligase
MARECLATMACWSVGRKLQVDYMRNKARAERLAADYDDLLKLESRSDFIHVQPVDAIPGWPPEKYLVTFTCLGIAGIDARQRPVPSERHIVSITLTAEYPVHEPKLEWVTEIWHPNIDRIPPRHVCVNSPETFYLAKSLADQVLTLGEMVQYKSYHAKHEYPWPQDHDVAKWVREVAEVNGWVGPGKPYDSRPLLRELKIRREAVFTRIHLGSAIRLGVEEG